MTIDLSASSTTLEGEGATREEALTALRSRVPRGWLLGDSQIVSDGEVHSIEGHGLTLEAAWQNGLQQVPEGAVILRKTEIGRPESAVFIVREADQEQAKAKIAALAAGQRPPGVVVRVTLVQPPGRGLFGLRKEPPHHEGEIVRPARVRIDYQAKARLRAETFTVGFGLRAHGRPRENALIALASALKAGTIHSEDVFDLIVAALEPTRAPGTIRYQPEGVVTAVIIALEATRDPRAVPVLLDLARNEWHAQHAVMVLTAIVEPTLPALAPSELRRLATLSAEQAWSHNGPYDVAIGGRGAVDCSALHQMAGRELERRGEHHGQVNVASGEQ